MQKGSDNFAEEQVGVHKHQAQLSSCATSPTHTGAAKSVAFARKGLTSGVSTNSGQTHMSLMLRFARLEALERVKCTTPACGT